LQLLISHPNTDLDLYDNNLINVLSYSILYCCDDIVLYIIPKVKDINHCNIDGNSGLDIALARGRDKIIRRLLLTGAKFYEERPFTHFPNTETGLKLTGKGLEWRIRYKQDKYKWMAEFDLLKYEIAKLFALVVCICDNYFIVRQRTNVSVIKRIGYMFNKKEQISDQKEDNIKRFFNNMY
jgi:hypothetical protein